MLAFVYGLCITVDRFDRFKEGPFGSHGQNNRIIVLMSCLLGGGGDRSEMAFQNGQLRMESFVHS